MNICSLFKNTKSEEFVSMIRCQRRMEQIVKMTHVMANNVTPKFHKTVIINRAVSGSGKTTLSKCVTTALRDRGLTVAVHSTDDFFMVNGRYAFDLEKLNGYHKQNLANFIADLERGTDIVICDNMNLLPWQSKPYTDAARAHNYQVLFLNFLPRELEKHMAAQIVTEQKPDAHGLSKELLERFIRNFNDYNDLLYKNTIRDIKRHRDFAWNNTKNAAVETGKLSQYYDSDAIITIRPDEYQVMKEKLPGMVLQIVSEDSRSYLPANNRKLHYSPAWYYGFMNIQSALQLKLVA